MSEELRWLMNSIAEQMGRFHELLAQRAGELDAAGADRATVAKLAQGADAMRDSGNIYISWAKHYVVLAEGSPAESSEDEEGLTDFEF
ncbi:MAG: hypothetical protein D6690_08395 [Nitrospirae bacterium]|nr:MAG: hypothetical protein D6690_08395 [Nitrospirota bacterium]